jgi:TolB-like protein/DNA-binding winged helix-turn-helix (wHTH) protein/Flp pilus assembly protein TadD
MVRFSLFEADLRTAELRRNGRRVKLEGQPFQILARLLARPGELVTREELQKALWPADTFVDFEHSINAAMKRLREALGDSAESPRFIETLPKRGYRFICPIHDVDRRLATSSPVVVPAGRRTLLRVAMVVVTLAAGLSATNAWGLRDWLFGPSITTLAVLPVRNVSGDPGQNDYADGFTRVLMGNLTRITSLRVLPYQSVRQLTRDNHSLADMGRALSVQFVLDSSIALDEDSIHLTAQFVQVAPQTIVWSQNYDLELTRAISLQNELCLEVANHLRLELSPKRLARVHDVDPRAWKAFDLGVAFFHKGTEEARGQAEELFLRAKDLDATFTQPWAYLALLWAHGGKYLLGPDPDQGQSARAAAEAALRDDDASSEAHAALGWLDLMDMNWRDAEAEFRRAIFENPNLAVARTWYAQGLSSAGRSEDAIAQAQLAMALAPDDASAMTHAAVVYFETRPRHRVDDAVRIWKDVVKWAPDYWAAHNFLGRAYLVQGHYEEAIREVELASMLRNADRVETSDIALMAFARFRAGQHDAAIESVKDLRRRKEAGEKKIAPYWLALAYAGIDDKEQALDWLEKGFNNRGKGMFFLNSEPLFDSLRGHPRFEAMITANFDPLRNLTKTNPNGADGTARRAAPRGR